MEIVKIIPFIFVIIFIGLIFIMPTILYELGGWKSLENKYKTLKQPNELNAKKLKIRSVSIESTGYNNIIKFYETEKGLLLKHGWFLRKTKYNILIPWLEIIEVRERKVFFYKSMRMIIGNPFVSFIDLGEKDFKKIKKLNEKDSKSS